MDDVGRLIHYAGAREPVDAERMEKARERVAGHWETVVEDRQASRTFVRFRPLAVAASFAAVIGLSFVFIQSTNTPPTPGPAQIDRILGDVTIAGVPAVKGGEIEADTLIETGASGRIALRMAGGQSLRIDTSSRLVVHSPNHVALDSGGVYIDTDAAANSLPVLVSTPMGTAQDVGTQFQVRLTDSLLIIGVRDGLVEVARQGQQNVSVNKGRYLELDISGRQSERPIDSDDPSWDWITTVVPDFEIEGASLKEFLTWYASERGLSLNWEDSVSGERAAQAILTGSIAGASLSEGLEIVRRIAPFEYRLDDESIWIKVN